MGDFNSRTGTEKDFYEHSEFDAHFTEAFIEIVDECNDVNILDDLNISRSRNSPDLIINSYGRKLLDFCKNNNMFILNGRLDGDKIGKPTSRNLSVVDYVLSSTSCLSKIFGFEVLEFSKLYSDIHAPLFLCLRTCNVISETPIYHNYVKESIGKWEHDKSCEYNNNIDINKTNDILTCLLCFFEDIEHVDKPVVNDIVNYICDDLLTAAKNTFGFNVSNKNDKKYNQKKLNKEWFSTECRNARKEFRKSKRLYKHYGSNIFRERLKYSEKLYKKLWMIVLEHTMIFCEIK